VVVNDSTEEKCSRNRETKETKKQVITPEQISMSGVKAWVEGAWGRRDRKTAEMSE